jgi:hypothetical protein
MKRYLLLIPVVFIVVFYFNGKKPPLNPIQDQAVISKWTKAVINLEFRTVLGNETDQIEKLHDWKKKYNIGFKNYSRALDSINNIGIVGSGTAIYIKIGSNRCLLTARHVLHDDLSPDSNAICSKFFLTPNGSELKKLYSTRGDVMPDPRAVLMLPRSYIFSSIRDDLGAIIFDHMDAGFAAYLDSQGYKPITLADIDTSWDCNVGDDIMAIGFPDFSIVQDRGLNESGRNWGSNNVSLPVITSGKISSIEPDNIDFSGNIFTFHGNSGGPIIRNNKLIGIVSGFTRTEYSIGNPPLNRFFIQTMIFKKSSCAWNFLQGKPLDSR